MSHVLHELFGWAFCLTIAWSVGAFFFADGRKFTIACCVLAPIWLAALYGDAIAGAFA